MNHRDTVQNSILTQFRSTIWEPFLLAVERYKLVSDGDRIAVCISGGKDSMLLAKLLEEYKRQSTVGFELTYLVMDPGYNRKNRKKIESNAELLGIPISVFESDIFEVTDKSVKSPCYLCARMRRGHLYSEAKKRGCNKIALGHHLNDVIETTLMGMLYGSQVQGMLAKLHSDNFPGMELIRPMYCIREDDIIAWRDYNSLEFIQCACQFTQNISESENDIGSSKRQEIKQLIKELKFSVPNVEENIFRGIHNLNLDSMPGYKTGGVKHTFSDNIIG